MQIQAACKGQNKLKQKFPDASITCVKQNLLATVKPKSTSETNWTHRCKI